MTEDDLKRLETLCAKATMGPWKATPSIPSADVGLYMDGGPDEDLLIDFSHPNAVWDVHFIAVARDAVPRLIAEVRDLKHQVQIMEPAYYLERARNPEWFNPLTKFPPDPPIIPPKPEGPPAVEVKPGSDPRVAIQAEPFTCSHDWVYHWHQKENFYKTRRCAICLRVEERSTNIMREDWKLAKPTPPPNERVSKGGKVCEHRYVRIIGELADALEVRNPMIRCTTCGKESKIE